MSGGGGDAPHPPAANGGEFLLSLLHKQSTPSQHSTFISGAAPVRQPHQHQQQPLLPDPAVAAVGRTLPDAPTWPPSNGVDLPRNFPHSISPAFTPNLLGFPQNAWPPLGDQFNANQRASSDDLTRLGLSGVDANVAIQILMQQKQLEQRLVHSSSLGEAWTPQRVVNGNLFENPKYDVSKGRELHNGSTANSVFDRDRQFDSPVTSNSNAYAFQHEVSGERGRTHPHRGNFRQVATGDTRGPPPGFPGRPRGGANLDLRNRGSYEYIAVDKERSGSSRSGNSRVSHGDGKVRSSSEVSLTEQLDQPGPSAGSSLHSVPAAEVEDSFMVLHSTENRGKVSGRDKFPREDVLEVDDTGEELIGSLTLEDETDEKNEKKHPQNLRDKEFRKDSRGRWIMNQRMRNLKSFMECRRDIGRLNASFLALYESLIPQEEEKVRQKELLDLLEKLVTKEWPQARLYLYGSCANSFGVSKSDIDVCMAIDDGDINKSEVLLKLADILQSDNLQNVQALTRARVPIVKLMDPATGISCDICINNILAVVNTKLLRDYAQIDVRLRQLAFIVKHWAKCRKVNETYQGTLSSYAYVLMCIHFLQQRRPAILPCLQGMETTYTVSVDDVNCSFFDQVEKLRNFGSQNKETIAQLVWGFFKYWAYVHDYANSVVSVRTGSTISKQEKLWTRRVGNDRHLICIEDPFETEHDLGRVVDKFSIRVLREEFERAAEIMQYDHNPCVKLFEPYLPS